MPNFWVGLAIGLIVAASISGVIYSRVGSSTKTDLMKFDGRMVKGQMVDTDPFGVIVPGAMGNDTDYTLKSFMWLAEVHPAIGAVVMGPDDKGTQTIYLMGINYKESNIKSNAAFTTYFPSGKNKNKEFSLKN